MDYAFGVSNRVPSVCSECCAQAVKNGSWRPVLLAVFFLPFVFGDCVGFSPGCDVSAPLRGVEERLGSGAWLPGQRGHRVFMHPQ